MTMTTIDLSRYLADSHNTGHGWWLYRFPNGHSASVIPDQRLPFRFEMQVDGESSQGQPVPGLTTEQVETRLSELAAADRKPADTTVTALVTVDERGRLTPESTVTVGEFTWPVPEKAVHGGVLWASRVAQVLREHGYQPTDIDVNEDASPAGTVLVRVRAIETNGTEEDR